MDRDPSSQPVGRWQPLLRKADQVTVSLMVLTGFLAILLHWTWSVIDAGSLINVEKAPAGNLEFRVNVNEADWPELTLLPRIGETLAHRIVEYREQHGPFQTVDELQQVKGIGPKTMRVLEPHVYIDVSGNDSN